MSRRTALAVPVLALVLALGAGPATGADEGCHRLDMEVTCQASSAIVLVGDPFSATATVRNTGDLPLANVTLAISGSEGIKQVGTGDLKLNIEKLEPGETKELAATFVCDIVGEWRISAHARDKQGWAAAGCFCGVLLKGLPAIQVEMIDLDQNRQKKGIFEMGETFIYQLVVVNDVGTALTPDLKIVWSLPPELKFVSGTGDRGVTVSGNGQAAESSSFVLAPNQELNFEVVVEVVGVPDRNLVQARASVVTAQSGVELATETESTTLKARVK
jgi:hypothetical protein